MGSTGFPLSRSSILIYWIYPLLLLLSSPPPSLLLRSSCWLTRDIRHQNGEFWYFPRPPIPPGYVFPCENFFSWTDECWCRLPQASKRRSGRRARVCFSISPWSSVWAWIDWFGLVEQEDMRWDCDATWWDWYSTTSVMRHSKFTIWRCDICATRLLGNAGKICFAIRSTYITIKMNLRPGWMFVMQPVEREMHWMSAIPTTILSWNICDLDEEESGERRYVHKDELPSKGRPTTQEKDIEGIAIKSFQRNNTGTRISQNQQHIRQSKSQNAGAEEHKKLIDWTEHIFRDKRTITVSRAKLLISLLYSLISTQQTSLIHALTTNLTTPTFQKLTLIFLLNSQGQGPARRRPRQGHLRQAQQGRPVLPPHHRCHLGRSSQDQRLPCPRCSCGLGEERCHQEGCWPPCVGHLQ